MTEQKCCVSQSLQLFFIYPFLFLFGSLLFVHHHLFPFFPLLCSLVLLLFKVGQVMMVCLQAECDRLPVQNVRHHVRAQEA